MGESEGIGVWVGGAVGREGVVVVIYVIRVCLDGLLSYSLNKRILFRLHQQLHRLFLNMPIWRPIFGHTDIPTDLITHRYARTSHRECQNAHFRTLFLCVCVGGLSPPPHSLSNCPKCS